MGYRVFTFYCSHQRLLLGNAAFTEFFSLFFLPSFQGARRYCVTAAIKTKSNEWATGFILSPPLTGLFFAEFFFFKYFTEFLNGRPQSTPTNHNFHKWFHDAKKNGFHKSTLERERITFFFTQLVTVFYCASLI